MDIWRQANRLALAEPSQLGPHLSGLIEVRSYLNRAIHLAYQHQIAVRGPVHKDEAA